MAIFKGRVRVRYGYSRWGYTRNNGKGWHGGSDEEGLDSTTILMPDYKGKSISGRVITARKVDKSTGSKTWEWGWYVCVELDAGQTPDAVNYLYFCHNARNLVSVGQRVKSGDALAVMGSTGNASLASPPFAHCHFEVRATAAGAGLDPTAYTGHPNAVGTYGEAIDETEDSDMKFLEVTSGKCEVFTAPDVNAVDISVFGLGTVAAITVLCYLAGTGVKTTPLDNKYIPVICGGTGLVLGLVALYAGMPEFPATDPITAAAVGVVSGLAATGINQAVKQLGKTE